MPQKRPIFAAQNNKETNYYFYYSAKTLIVF